METPNGTTPLLPAIKRATVKAVLGTLEEKAMIAILNLGEQRSYGLEILRVLEDMTGKSQTVGSVYTTLGRLVEKGFLEASMGEPTSERGGRRKRFYKITAPGYKVLEEKAQQHEAAQQAYAKLLPNLGGAA